MINFISWYLIVLTGSEQGAFDCLQYFEGVTLFVIRLGESC